MEETKNQIDPLRQTMIDTTARVIGETQNEVLTKGIGSLERIFLFSKSEVSLVARECAIHALASFAGHRRAEVDAEGVKPVKITNGAINAADLPQLRAEVETMNIYVLNAFDELREYWAKVHAANLAEIDAADRAAEAASGLVDAIKENLGKPAEEKPADASNEQTGGQQFDAAEAKEVSDRARRETEDAAAKSDAASD